MTIGEGCNVIASGRACLSNCFAAGMLCVVIVGNLRERNAERLVKASLFGVWSAAESRVR